jgi:hypothetical protein
MTNGYAPDLTLLKLNDGIQTALREYVPDAVAIRFDLPDPDELPAEPTVSVFLYDIQEDLGMRTGESRQYAPGTGAMIPGYVHVRCCYLITYWDPSHGKGRDAPSAGPSSQAVSMMNFVLNALLNTRSFSHLPGSYTRVIPPAEQLNSLGNFWQSLGNKPRLSLSYAVTIPIRLADKNETCPPVTSMGATLDAKPGVDVLARASGLLLEKLAEQLAQDGEDVGLSLRKVTIRCVPAVPGVNGAVLGRAHGGEKVVAQRLDITLSGVTDEAWAPKIRDVIGGWLQSDQPVCIVEGVELFVVAADLSGLIGVPAAVSNICVLCRC